MAVYERGIIFQDAPPVPLSQGEVPVVIQNYSVIKAKPISPTRHHNSFIPTIVGEFTDSDGTIVKKILKRDHTKDRRSA